MARTLKILIPIDAVWATFYLFFFFWYWGSNLGPCAWQAGEGATELYPWAWTSLKKLIFGNRSVGKDLL